MTKTCQGCLATGLGKQGSVADNTPPGWRSCMTSTGEILYFCETCAKKIGALTEELMTIVKHRHASFVSLVRMGRPDPHLLSLRGLDPK